MEENRAEKLETARNELKKYIIAKREIECINMASLPGSPVISDMPRGTSYKATDTKWLDRMDKKEQLEEQMATIKRRIMKVDDGSYKGQEESAILGAKYMDGLKITELMDVMCMSNTTVKDKTRAALLAYYNIMKKENEKEEN